MNGISEQRVPRARAEGLIIEELPDETLVYDLEKDKAHCLNRASSFVWKHCDGERTVAEISRLTAVELNSPVGEEAVWLALRQLEKRRLLESGADFPAFALSLSRRRMMKSLGMGAAILPLIISVAAPAAAQAGTCAGDGQSCATVPCCPGLVCDFTNTCRETA